MGLRVHLSTFGLSLALLVGGLVHDAAGTRMSIDMAASNIMEQQARSL